MTRLSFPAVFLLLLGLTFGAPSFSADASLEKGAVKTAFKTLDLENAASLQKLEPESVRPYQSGFEKSGDVYVCDAKDANDSQFGVLAFYRLDQKVPTPLIAAGWSRAENVGGNKDSNYSLYVDLVYDDGTPLWGQTYSFQIGSTDWSKGKVAIFPDKPIKWISFYAMFRDHSGKAEFKDLALYQYNVESQVAYFDGNPIKTSNQDVKNNAGVSPKLYLRDVAANSDYLEIENVEKSLYYDELNLTVEQKKLSPSQDSDVRESTIVLKNQTAADRALSLVYSLPFPDLQQDVTWEWFENPRKSRAINSTELASVRSMPNAGAQRASHYPFGVVAAKNADGKYVAAYGVAIDPNFPAFYRIACNGTTRELYIAFDLALTKEKPQAEFRVLPLFWKYEQDSADVVPSSNFVNAPNVPFGSTPFRAAFDVYRQLFPENFFVRAIKQGNWMAFAKISKVDHSEDFGFQFKEGIDETAADDEKGITSFRYTEPMTWWQSVPKSDSTSKSLQGAFETAKKLALESNLSQHNSAEARSLLTTGFKDKDGKPYGLLLDTPWCDGVVWSINDAPGLVELAAQNKLADDENAGVKPTAGFEIKWNEQLANDLYSIPLPEDQLPQTREEFLAAQTKSGCDGEYVDSSEGYVTALLDFNRANFAGMKTPLVFDSDDKSPAIFRGLIAFEYVKKIADDVHARGKLAMANSTPYNHFWLTTQLDVVGTETNWRYGGNWNPMPDDELMYRRVLTCGKPYCFLMNTDFSQFSKEDMERFMRRSLAYGMFPSCFSADASTKHYFENSALYERDRDLFKHYMPIVINVAEAGWEPETCAVSSDPKLYVERFGALKDARVSSNALRPDDSVYLTLFNDSEEEKEFTLELGQPIVDHMEKTQAAIVEQVENRPIAVSENKISGKLAPQDVRVFKIASNKAENTN